MAEPHKTGLRAKPALGTHARDHSHRPGDHLHAHLQSAIMSEENLELPAAALIVSGGHTSLYDYNSPLKPELLGSTIDDAAGEAADGSG